MKRVAYYDNIKGFLILCVVLLHTISISKKFYGYDISYYKIISFFLMPLFIFITGKFSKKSKKTPFKRFFHAFKIYFIAQILVTLYYGFVLKIISPTKSLLTPRFTLWYLLTNAFLYLSIYIIKKLGFKKSFILSMLIALFSGFLKCVTNFMSISRTLAILPFFVIGYFDDEINILEKVKKYKKIIFLLTAVITIWFFYNKDYFLYKDLYIKYNFYSYSNPIKCFEKRLLLYAIYFIYTPFMMLIVPKSRNLLSYFGDKTLMIYLFHGAFLKTLLKYKIFLKNEIIGTVVTYMLVIISSLIFFYIVKYLKILKEKFKNDIKLRFSKKQVQKV